MPDSYTPTEQQFEPVDLPIFDSARFAYERLTGSGLERFFDTVEVWWNVFSVIAILFSMLCFAGFIYARIRYAQIMEIEESLLRQDEQSWANKHARPDSRNARWDIIQKRVAENNPESWRVAIIEADILLDETLTNAGYVGQTLGEKLKSANVQSFTTVQDAWEAHKIRNQIAHAGSDFVLTQRVAQETIVRFERVFREFGVV